MVLDQDIRVKHNFWLLLMTAKAVSNRKQVDACILNFSKAFDKVPHQRLLHKLEFYGITSSILGWLTEFLLDCSQQVAINGMECCFLHGHVKFILVFHKGSALLFFLCTLMILQMVCKANYA